MMTFIVVFIALLIERFFDWSHLRQWQWFNSFQGYVARRLPGKSPYIILGITVIALALIVQVVNMLIANVLYGFIKLLFQLLILLFCLGPRNLWANAFACITALAQGDDQDAAAKLKTSFGIADTTHPQSLHRQLLNLIFIESNRRVFAVVFWFVILGPAGAVLYRCVTQSAAGHRDQEVPRSLTVDASLIESILDWVPVRIFTFIFALGGHFVHVLSCWRKKVGSGLDSNETLLTECGAAALGVDDDAKLPSDGSVEHSAISLIDRAFIIVLVVIAVLEFVF